MDNVASVGRLKIDFHTAAGGAREEEGPAEVEGGIRLEEERRRPLAEAEEERREEVLEEEEAAARGP